MRLRSLGIGLTLTAFAAGLGSGWLWFASAQNWERHLTRAELTGAALYEVLRTGAPAPPGLLVSALPQEEAALASAGAFTRLPDAPSPAFVTNVSLHGAGTDLLAGPVLSLAIVSDRLQYATSQIVSAAWQPTGQQLGQVTRLLATYCSEPMVYARSGDGRWFRIDGRAVWGCGAAPMDLRLGAALLAAVALAVLLSLVGETTSHFPRFARALLERRRLGGPDSYAVQGPDELREIVAAVNANLEAERAALERRARVLSGVSHDLGTPATRLRLRTALIADAELRGKLDGDIDAMTGMIESVLTYTRAEMNAETPRNLSLDALLEAIVDDYRDTGAAVTLSEAPERRVTGGRSVFGARQGHGIVPSAGDVIVRARPIALKRAITNLIDNALKYGRRADVRLEADSEVARIIVQDDGQESSAAEVEALIAPFRRGENTRAIAGHGMGLTIASTIAQQHGGALRFVDGPGGLMASISIRRA